MSIFSGCAAQPSDMKVRHRLKIEVHKSVGRIINIHYSYGDELLNEALPSAGAISAFENFTASMSIPKEFLISWQTMNGQKHNAEVPVRSRLHNSIENKTIVFVIMLDHVEGYVSISTPFGERRERFY